MIFVGSKRSIELVIEVLVLAITPKPEHGTQQLGWIYFPKGGRLPDWLGLPVGCTQIYK